MLGITGYKETQATSFAGELPKLEPGGYVLKILAVKIEKTQNGAKLALQFDIAEGEQKDFFKKLYDATPSEWESKKWKGSYRIKIPKHEGDDTKYRKSVGFFKSQLEAFEKSNANLYINAESEWDEQVLKGKLVGGLFNEKEFDFKGKHGMFTQCKRLMSAEDIRNCNFSIPKPDMLNANATAAPSNIPTDLSDFVEIDSDTVPF
jgi:hypothetical protein